MQIKTEEISLEELNNNVVEYVLKSPHNTNPAILRQMLNSRGVSSRSFKDNIVFSISNHENGGATFVNIVTEEVITPEDFAKIILSGTGLYASENSLGTQINGKGYDFGSVLGFTTSGNSDIGFVATQGRGINVIKVYNQDFVEKFLETLTKEIIDA